MSKTYISAALRQLVINRADQQCEYCLISEMDSFARFEIDHIIAEKHGGSSEAHNLAYACPVCNKFKGTDVASYDLTTGELTPLFNPRIASWLDHFSLLEQGNLEGRTPVGRVTIRLLQLNRAERIKERQLLIANSLLSIPKSQ